jgi:4-aminobutyrate aminotransferase-like enzyme
METKKLYDEYLITSMVPAFDPVEVESARGASVHCASGKVYLDCFSGIAVCNAGHGHPKVIAAAFTPGSHLSTFGGNPVSCAAALANIDVTQAEKLPENAEARGATSPPAWPPPARTPAC